MKQPCIGFSSTAGGQLRNFDPFVRIEIDDECQLAYGELEPLAKKSSEQDFYKEFQRNVSGSMIMITYRRPKAGDCIGCCKRRMALWVISID